MQTITMESIRELPYFEEEDEELLNSIMSPDNPLLMPELGVIQQELAAIKELVYSESFHERTLLASYFKLRESHLNTDIFCGWRDGDNNVCGGLMRIEVSHIGAFYQCKINNSHRTRK